jgi:hypothetical protein
MTGHPTKKELDEYCHRVLAPDAFMSVHRHVSECARCAAQCNSPQQLGRDLVHLHEALGSEPDGTPYHLSASEVATYARGSLDEIDLEIAESHLSVCNTCLNEVKQQIAVTQVAEPAAFKSRRPVVTSSTWNRWPWRVAAAVLGVAVLILVSVWLLRTRPAKQVDQAEHPINQSSPAASSTAEVKSSGEPAPLSSGQGSLPNRPLAVELNDGSTKVTMNTEGTLAGLEQLPARIQQKVRAALQTGKLDQPATLAQLNSQPSTLLSESGNGLPFRLLSPLGQVIRTQQPNFRWQALPDAQSYKVTVTDADLNEVATSPALDATEWRITQPLKPGGIYSWQVTALKNGVAVTSPVLPAPQAKFKILDRSTLETIQQVEHAEPGSHLTRGVLYAEAGLLDQAEQELRLLVRQNPGSEIANKLLRSVQAMRAAQTSSSGRG